LKLEEESQETCIKQHGQIELGTSQDSQASAVLLLFLEDLLAALESMMSLPFND